ncbi:MAG: PKD domain-containing protein [Bacteroidia bacterium]|nr:PKD domain-containing protein [Bacteroidia bacterium]
MRYVGLVVAAAWAQTTLYFQNFNGSSTSSPPPGWQLNTTDMGGVTPPTSNNMWRIGAHYASLTVNVPIPSSSCLSCLAVTAPLDPIPNQPPTIAGAPNSEFIHISFSGYQCCAPPPQPTASFSAAGNPGVPSETYFAKYTTGVSIPAGATNVRLTLFWICHGNANAYGEVLYSTAGPMGPWTALTSSVTNSTKFFTSSGSWQQWRADTIPLPVTPPTTVYLALRFVNQTGANNDPPFIVDDIGVIANVPSSQTITLTSTTPNPICAGNQLSVAFTHSGFSGSPSFQAQLLDASNNVVATSASSTSSPITFTVPSTLPSGNYAVRVVSGSVQSSTQSIQVINLSSFTCSAGATTVQAGNPVTFTLSGSNLPGSGTLSVSFTPGDGSPAQSLTYNLPGDLPATLTYTYTTAGNYTASFTASYGGCTYTCTQNISVTAPAGPSLVIGAVASPLCAGGGVTVPFQATGFPAGTTFTVEIAPVGSSSWTALCSGTSSPISCTLDGQMAGGSYVVRVRGGTPPVYSQDRQIEVIQMQGLTCNITPSPAYVNEPVSISIGGSGLPSGPFSIEFAPGGGLPNQNQSANALPTTLNYTYTSTGAYSVQITVTHTASGCRGSCDIPLSVQNRPSGGNPSSLITISTDGQSILVREGVRVEVFDALGRTVYVGQSSASIPILRNTLYILRVWSEKGVEVFRFYMP